MMTIADRWGGEGKPPKLAEIICEQPPVIMTEMFWDFLRAQGINICLHLGFVVCQSTRTMVVDKD